MVLSRREKRNLGPLSHTISCSSTLTEQLEESQVQQVLDVFFAASSNQGEVLFMFKDSKEVQDMAIMEALQIYLSTFQDGLIVESNTM